MIGTPEKPDILDYLDSGLDNVEKNECPVELGGVLITMKDAAKEIRRLRTANKKLTKALYEFRHHKPNVGYSRPSK